MISLIFIENWNNSLYFQALAWNFLTYFHLIHQNIYVKNNVKDSDTIVRHQNAFLEYLKPLEWVLSKLYSYFHRKKLKNTTNIEFLYKFNEDGISTLGFLLFLRNCWNPKKSGTRGTDSVLIKFTQEFDICGVFELFSMKITLEFAQNRL